MTTIGHPIYYQPNRYLLIHLNNHTHSSNPITNGHQPYQNTTTLKMNPNSSHIMYTYYLSNKELTTTLIHTTPSPVQSNKRSIDTRKTTTLPKFNHTITLPVTRSLLYQHTQLIMVAHLIITTPNPRNVQYPILYYRHPPTCSDDIMSPNHVFPLDRHYHCCARHATNSPTAHIIPTRLTL